MLAIKLGDEYRGIAYREKISIDFANVLFGANKGLGKVSKNFSANVG